MVRPRGTPRTLSGCLGLMGCYPAAGSAESLLGEAGTHTGGYSHLFSQLLFHYSLVGQDAQAISPSPRWESLMIERFNVRITSGTILLHSFGKCNRIYSDN